LSIDEQAAAELAQKANDAVARAEEIGTREAHAAAEFACSGAAYAYQTLDQQEQAALFWRLMRKHRNIAERMLLAERKAARLSGDV
jgi:pyrroline-5-carboxylate reductase